MRQQNITEGRTYFTRKLKFNYDRLNDLLYVHKEDSHVYSNVVVGDFHLEFDRNMKVVGVEILKASELLKEYEISKGALEHIDKVDLKVVVKDNSLLVFLIIHALKEEKAAAITMNNLDVMPGDYCLVFCLEVLYIALISP